MSTPSTPSGLTWLVSQGHRFAGTTRDGMRETCACGWVAPDVRTWFADHAEALLTTRDAA